MRVKSVPAKAILVLCITSFLAGSLFTSSRNWTATNQQLQNMQDEVVNGYGGSSTTLINRDNNYDEQSTTTTTTTTTPVLLQAQADNSIINNARLDGKIDHKRRLVEGNSKDIMGEVARTHQAIQSLDKTISTLEMELSAARISQTAGIQLYSSKRDANANTNTTTNTTPRKAFVVVGINTAFSSKRRRDSIRDTWMPQGSKLKKLEKEKGIVIRFVIGHSATPGGVLDKAIDAEEAENGDFLRLKHVEGYHELSTKTRLYFSTASSIWDADFYVKVDDDVHLNLGMLATTLSRYRAKPRIYIGCMKSGPVLSQKGVKYHEPEYWKFGEEGNKYFRHATGQIYAISKDLAAYISINA